jgi:hypothetical protein
MGWRWRVRLYVAKYLVDRAMDLRKTSAWSWRRSALVSHAAVAGVHLVHAAIVS